MNKKKLVYCEHWPLQGHLGKKNLWNYSQFVTLEAQIIYPVWGYIRLMCNRSGGAVCSSRYLILVCQQVSTVPRINCVGPLETRMWHYCAQQPPPQLPSIRRGRKKNLFSSECVIVLWQMHICLYAFFLFVLHACISVFLFLCFKVEGEISVQAMIFLRKLNYILVGKS